MLVKKMTILHSKSIRKCECFYCFTVCNIVSIVLEQSSVSASFVIVISMDFTQEVPGLVVAFQQFRITLNGLRLMGLGWSGLVHGDVDKIGKKMKWTLLTATLIQISFYQKSGLRPKNKMV